MDTLTAGNRISINQDLQSESGKHSLVMQADGNLVIYEGWPTVPSAVWESGTEWLPTTARPTYLAMQADGNLVLYNDATQPAWATGTDGHPGASAVMQDDRNFVVYDANHQPLWATNTLIDPGSTVIQAHKVDTVGSDKVMTSDITMYANGVVVVSTSSKNGSWASGLRPRVLVVARDSKARAIYVTDPIEFSTLCSVPDPSCASSRQEQKTFAWPEVVAEYTSALDVYQGDGANYVNIHNQLVEAAKTISDVAANLKDAIALLKLL